MESGCIKQGLRKKEHQKVKVGRECFIIASTGDVRYPDRICCNKIDKFSKSEALLQSWINLLLPRYLSRPNMPTDLAFRQYVFASKSTKNV
jgi:hypothetical protein